MNHPQPQPGMQPNPQSAGQPLLYNGPIPVSMGDRGGPVRPGQSLLFSTEEGDLVELPRRPSAFGALKYRFRYEVDRSDQTMAWSEPLSSGTGGFPFQASFEARWRVTDPAEVVRRGIDTLDKAHAAVCVAMRDLLWPYAARYGIEQLDDFDQFVRTSVSSRPHTLPVGVTVDPLIVRIYLDSAAAEHLRALKQQEFDEQLVKAGHSVALTSQTLDAELQAKREEVLLAAARGEGGLLLHLIAQNPANLHEIMLELGQRQDVQQNQKADMLRMLIDAGHLQPAEAHALWEDMHRPAPLFPTATPGQVSGGGAGQLTAGGTGTPGAGASGGATGAPGGNPQPAQPQHQQQPSVVAGVVVPPTPGGAPPRPRRRPATPPQAPAQQAPAQQGQTQQAQAPAQQGNATGGGANVSGATPVGRNRKKGSGGSPNGSQP